MSGESRNEHIVENGGRAYFIMICAWMLWSLDPIMVRLIGDGVPRTLMAGATSLFTGLLLCVPARRGFLHIVKDRSLLVYFAVYVILFTTLADILYVFAVRNLNPGLVSLILRSQIVMAVLAAWVVFGERPDGLTVLGIVIVLAGYGYGAYVSMGGLSVESRNPVAGWTLSFAAAILWTGGTISGKKLLERIPSGELCGMRMMSAGLLTTCLFLCSGSAGAGFASMGLRQWLLIAVRSAFCSALAYSLYLYGLRRTSVTAAAAIEQSAPLFTLLVSALLLGEAISGCQWLSVLVVTAGAALVVFHQWRQ